MDFAGRRPAWRVLAAPLIALALLIGYVVYAHTVSDAPTRHVGAATSPPKAAPKATKVTAADLLLAATTASKGIHLQMDGVTGAASPLHTNHAVIDSFSWGVGVGVSIGTGAGTTVGKPSVSDINLQKVMDKYSVPLLNKELRGQPTLNAIVYFTDVTVGGVAYDYMEFDLHNVYVTGYSTSGGGDRPSESISLAYTGFTIKTHLPGVTGQVLSFNILTNVTS
jgi:type VI secretion system secreted protein Hcp